VRQDSKAGERDGRSFPFSSYNESNGQTTPGRRGSPNQLAMRVSGCPQWGQHGGAAAEALPAPTVPGQRFVLCSERGGEFGGEPNPPDLVPTGETRTAKNPIHTEITNWWNKVLRRVNSEQ